MWKRALIVAVLAATVALPFVLRPPKAERGRVDETLVIITPHNEAIRHEYARGFRHWYRERTGKNVFIDWRVIGGTSEIARFLEGEYATAFQNHWSRKLGRPWSLALQSGFTSHRLGSDAPAEVLEARRLFLESNLGCGIDVFFGGGTFDFIRQAQAGRIVDSGVLRRHPEWFTDAVIPQTFAGEEYWDRDGRWIGTVLSAYGMVFNRESLRRLGFPGEPTRWEDLADPRLRGEVALADPTKSGSIAKAFENIIQQQMQRRLHELEREKPSVSAAEREGEAVTEGWKAGLRLIQLAGANARYFTDTSQKPPIDVATGNCAIGLCIDFYGRQQEEAVRRRDGSDRVGYVSPVGGTVSSVDPIALLRGAPNRPVAEAFIDYVLSIEGQKLWNFRVGAPGGPERFALRRLPVRRDFYGHSEWKAVRSDPDDRPFESNDPLVYRAAWTGGLFREMAFIIRVMCLDPHTELTRAWTAILAAPPERRAAALAVLQDLEPVAYAEAGGTIRRALQSRNKVDEVQLGSRLGREFRARYERAERIARGESP
ncbi:MAG: ABC transporter substrate-binding protein [Verrucomicrobia bacterium]|nr:ABC transporter substrate-binding protein [Verrucomicrobiota bacterium]